MKIYKHLYDNPKNKDGSDKENELLGEFELVDGDMKDYSYQVIVRDKDNKLFILHGREISGFYNPSKGGTQYSLEPLEENYFVKMYLNFNHQPTERERSKVKDWRIDGGRFGQ